MKHIMFVINFIYLKIKVIVYNNAYKLHNKIKIKKKINGYFFLMVTLLCKSTFIFIKL